MLSVFTRKVVYPTFWRYRNLNVGGRIEDYSRNQWLSNDQLIEIQWKKVKKLLSYAYANVPFYSKRMRESGCHPNDITSLDEFAQLPYLTKDDIIENKHELIATNYSAAELIPDSTGGSTGKNISFYEDRNELSHRFASIVRSDSWAGFNLGDKYAQVWGSPLDFAKASPIRKYVDKLFLRRLFISSFDLSDENLAQTVEHIRQFKPKVIIGYPTPLHRFARFLSDNNVGYLGIQAIISSAETLHDFQRDEIERKFRCKVFNRYGCREVGPIATECEYHQGLHVLTDRLVVEFINEGDCNRENGLKEIVVTDLHKFGMPFIRYRIGDMAIVSDRACPCGRGFPLIERIEGRTFDMVIGTNNNFVSGTFWTLLFRSVPGIHMFQVYQGAKDTLEINLELGKEFNIGHLNLLEKGIKEKCGKDMRIDFNPVPEINTGEFGKHRFVVSDVAQDYFAP